MLILGNTLILPDKILRQELEKRLRIVQKPYVWALLSSCFASLIGVLANSFYNNRWKNPDLLISDVFSAVLLLVILGGSLIARLIRNHTTIVVLIVRSIVCIIICLSIVHRYEGKEMQKMHITD